VKSSLFEENWFSEDKGNRKTEHLPSPLLDALPPIICGVQFVMYEHKDA
jgi:hypothetical protein